MLQARYRGTWCRSTSVMLQTVSTMVVCWCGATAAVGEVGFFGFVLRSGCTGLWALVVLRSYMIFHDCGHGSFYQGSRFAQSCNAAALQLSAVMCTTPTDWNVGHRLHHSHVGDVSQDVYDWGETVFQTATQFLALPPHRQRLWRVVRHPLVFFAVAPALTWYVKMRLPFELRPGRKAAYRTSNKLVSTCFMVARYALARQCSILAVVLLGDYAAMVVGVMMFHVQHAYEPGYVRGAPEWTKRNAALCGSSRLVVPAGLSYFTLGIEYHHLHHLCTRVPGYMLRTVHEEADPRFWADVVVLDASAAARSLRLQVYDDRSGAYSTYAAVLSDGRRADAGDEKVD